MMTEKQEWITDIECINVFDKVFPPIIIWKAKYIYFGWIPPKTFKNWYFGYSQNGWILNKIGLQ